MHRNHYTASCHTQRGVYRPKKQRKNSLIRKLSFRKTLTQRNPYLDKFWHAEKNVPQWNILTEWLYIRKGILSRFLLYKRVFTPTALIGGGRICKHKLLYKKKYTENFYTDKLSYFFLEDFLLKYADTFRSRSFHTKNSLHRYISRFTFTRNGKMKLIIFFFGKLFTGDFGNIPSPFSSLSCDIIEIKLSGGANDIHQLQNKETPDPMERQTSQLACTNFSSLLFIWIKKNMENKLFPNK